MTTDHRPGDSISPDPNARVAALEATVRQQKSMIEALVDAAERRLEAPDHNSAFARWEATLGLHRQVEARTQRIRAGERLLRSVVDSLDARMCIIGADGEILGLNRLWSDFSAAMGWPASQETPEAGGNVFALLPDLGEELGKRIEAEIRRVLAGEAAFATTEGHLSAGHVEEDITVRVNTVQDHDRARAVLAIVDITSAVRTRKELRLITDQAQLLALVAQHTDNGVMIQDVDGRIAWVNEAFCSLHGYRAEEVVGRYRRELTTTELAQTPAFLELEDAIAAARSADVQFPTQTKQGRTSWVHVQVQPILKDGRLVRFVSVERDITAERTAVEQLRAATRQAHELADELSREKALLTEVLSSIPHLVYWKDQELRYTGVNQGFLAIRAPASEESVLQRKEAELALTDGFSEVLLAAEARVMETGEPVENQRIVQVGGERAGSVLLLSILPRIDEKGHCHGVIGVAADVSHVTRLEQQLAQATRLESIGQLAAGVAHEINTPVQYVTDNTHFLTDSFNEVLTVLRAAENLVKGEELQLDGLRAALSGVDLDYLSTEIPDALSQCQEGLSRVSQIVRAMKDFSHPGHDRVDSDINRAVESTAQVSRNEWRYVADLELDLAPDAGTVPCHEGELKQVLLNIVVNAAQAIGQAEGRDETVQGKIVIRTRRIDSGVRITITDDGPGMDESVRIKIFDPFFTTKGVGEGTGQGLSMAYAVIVQKHGGTLSVDSTVGAGSTFTIELPDTLPG